MTPRVCVNLWKAWGCAGWFSGETGSLFSVKLHLYEPEMNYLFMFSLQIIKFSIEFGIDLRVEW